MLSSPREKFLKSPKLRDWTDGSFSQDSPLSMALRPTGKTQRHSRVPHKASYPGPEVSAMGPESWSGMCASVELGRAWETLCFLPFPRSKGC